MKPIIRVENLSKQYTIGAKTEPYATLRESIVRAARKPIDMVRRNGKAENTKFWALKDVNFDVMPGEVVGIIGRNGAGKSTLLKVLSRITEPTTGRVELYGRVGSLLEVGTGFHPELTGRENIFLNGAILGMRREEISKKFDEIVDFAEIEEFLDTPVKRYSSGMYVRLAFAVAAHLEPEILVVDEVLAVGDAQFQKKCLDKMKDVGMHGRTVLFVSHNMGAIRELCQHGVVLADGTVRFMGDVHSSIESYLDEWKAVSEAYVKSERNGADDPKPVEFNRISLHGSDGTERYLFEVEDQIYVKFDVEINSLPSNSSLFFMVLNKERVPVCAFESEGIQPQMTLKIDNHFLVRGTYSVHSFLHAARDKQFDVVYDQVAFEITDTVTPFVRHGQYHYGSVFGSGSWL